MKQFRLNLDLTSVIVILAAGVLLPVMLATAAGIVAVVIARDPGGIVTGVLVISFAATAAGSGLIALVFTGKKARLARQQSDFIASVSHEFRTPLSAIKLYAQTLQSGDFAGDPQRTSRCLKTILRETAWLETMIDKVLTWRASCKDMMAFDLVSKPISAAMNDAVDRFRAMVSPDEVKFSFSMNTHLSVRHDLRALNTVVLNLLTNAYKYTNSDKTIGVRVWDEEDSVMIEVRDNGIGMTCDEIKRIFDPFYRAGSNAQGARSGTGLGLAIVRHLVNLHQGTICVSSEKGGGSVFTIRLCAHKGSK